MTIEHTECQKKALDGLFKWIDLPFDDANDLFAVLEGPAGTGKTTVMRYFIKEIGTGGVGVSAPTHKAKKTIQNITGFKSETVQRILGLRPNVLLEKFDINKPQFDPLGEETIGSYKILIIDESSMLNADAFDLIVKRAAAYNVKILFLGDSYQLPPVNEHVSKVFVNVKHKFTLKTVVRQSFENPNTRLLLLCRRDIETGNDTMLSKLLAKGTNLTTDMGYHVVNNVDFGSAILKKYTDPEYSGNKDYIKYLAWTNKSVEAWCKGIRNHIFKLPNEEPFAEGEPLIGHNTVYTKTGVLIENSEDYVIESFVKGESSFKIPGYYITMRTPEGSKTEIFVVDPYQYHEYIKVYDSLLASAQRIRRLFKAFYAFKENHLLLYNIYKGQCTGLTAKYYSDLVASRDLYYGYGSTVHKSQGSTYVNSAVNLNNIYGNSTIEERKRLAYVALSRMTNENIILARRNG